MCAQRHVCRHDCSWGDLLPPYSRLRAAHGGTLQVVRRGAVVVVGFVGFVGVVDLVVLTLLLLFLFSFFLLFSYNL